MTYDEPPYDDPYESPRPRPAHVNPLAEKAVLGALLTVPQLAAAIALELTPSDFYEPKHETIWRAIHAVTAAGDLSDPVTVSTELNRRGELTRIGGALYLHDLMESCPHPTQAAAYADSVRNAARLRTLNEIGTRLSAISSSVIDPEAIDQAIARGMDELDVAAARLGPTARANITGLADLTWVKSGEPPIIDPPRWGRRTDGHALFYEGRVNGIYGDPEAAKTWLAQMALVEALDHGLATAIIDVDHNGAELTVGRLLLLGARPEALADPALFRLYEPEDGDELRSAIADATALGPAICVLDSIGEMLPMLGVKSTENDEITMAMRTLASPLAKAGTCVITIDHLPKSPEARATGFAIGGTAKKRAIDGAYIFAEARVQPAPGSRGFITLRIEKDRTGGLRKSLSGGKYIGTFILDSTDENVTRATVERSEMPRSNDGSLRPTHLMETISRLIEDNPGMTEYAIRSAVKGKATTVRSAIAQLIREGFLDAQPGPRNATLHSSVSPYREAEDDAA